MLATRWYLNNNNTGAGEAAQKFGREIDATALFVYDTEERERLRRVVDRLAAGEEVPSREVPAFNMRRVIFCLVERIEDRIPNKDIVEVEIYPPFQDAEEQALAMAGLHSALDAANNPAS